MAGEIFRFFSAVGDMFVYCLPPVSLCERLKPQVCELLNSPAYCDVKELEKFAKDLFAMPENQMRRDARKLCGRVIAIDQGGLKNPYLRKIYDILTGELPEEKELTKENTLTLVGKNGQAYRVSKAVALTFSATLRAAFAPEEHQHQWRERGLSAYLLSQYEDDVVEILQDFFRNNSIQKINSGNLLSVFACAHELQIPQLEMFCRNFLKAELTEGFTLEDLFDFYAWGEKYNEHWINVLCLDYLSKLPDAELSRLPPHYQWKEHTLPFIRMIRNQAIEIKYEPCGGIAVTIKKIGDVEQMARIFRAIQVKKIINHDYRVDAAQLLGSVVRTCPSVTHLDLRWSIVRGQGLEQLKAALKGNQSLQVLDLHGCGLDVAGAKSLLEILKEIRSLVYLDLGNDRDSSREARIVCSSMGEKGGEIYADFLKAHPSIKYFNVSHNGLGDAGVAKIAEALIENSVLLHLDLSENDTVGQAVEPLARMIKGNSKLRTLHLQTFAITNSEARTLADGLRENSTLEEINLSFNVIGDEGMRALTEAYKDKGRLPKINMQSNDVRSAGFRAFIQAMVCCRVVMHLLFKYNRVDDDGAIAVAEAIIADRNISKIDLEGNDLTVLGMDCIKEALSVRSKPIEVNFGEFPHRVR